MVPLGLIVFIAGLLLLWSAVTNHKLGDAAKQVLGGTSPSLKG